MNQIAFAAIPLDSTTLVSDKYKLEQVSSTAALLKEKINKQGHSVSLFGGIQYTMTEQEMAAVVRNDKEATEELFKTITTTTNPSIIHIATHGFFFPDPKKEKIRPAFGNEDVYRMADNPLNRSGIILAGANRAWNGQSMPEGAEDGILTAYEVGNLYLGSTQLVVLSACETGLGDIKGSEGVFGLQRSFKLAGVQYLMMSLWKVPDAETAAFMKFFYSNLFGGKTIPQSFAETQDYMKKKFPKQPYKWAAFVLVR